MTILPTSKNRRRALYRGLLVAVIAAIGALVLVGRLTDASVHGATMALAAAACVLCILDFTALDEMGQQAHYVAWCWGCGLAIVLIGALVVSSPRTS